MSEEALMKFFEKVDNDKEIHDRASEAKSPEALCEYAKTLGFEFTRDELALGIRKMQLPREREDAPLDEKELDNVTGGLLGIRIPVVTDLYEWHQDGLNKETDENEAAGRPEWCGLHHMALQ